MNTTITPLLERYPERVRAVLNLLLETPYFYREDNEDTFFFLRRHRQEFAQFFDECFGWSLVLDDKCARVHKPKWYNQAVSEANRDLFGFRRRDDCIGFMLLLEFFENQLDENSMTVEDRDNLRFRFGDLLTYTHRRFLELFPGTGDGRYSEDAVRAHVLRRILPVLERYRFLLRIPPPAGMEVVESDMIFEAMPALYHYNSSRLGSAVSAAEDTDVDAPGAEVLPAS
ncbi:MAG: DUF2398 family protein [Lentisphaeria bacterium]|nr:DUF2398 family protein [Lentisphaeria bacterium]